MVDFSTTLKAVIKPKYRICNQSEYSAGLKQRGNLALWIDLSLCFYDGSDRSPLDLDIPYIIDRITKVLYCAEKGHL
ncbi:MAG: hypothetical protein EA367_17605 [Leptolyngbya sp. DLM2.Bin15]|nr:MAG: hypothetical protein EA367_17605 [Leptolyngbya sp. DLM2.Bin15]